MTNRTIMKSVLALFLVCFSSMLKADEQLFAGTPVATLVEENLLASSDREIPSDGRIELRLPQGLPEKGLRLDDFSFDARSGMFVTRLISTQGDSIGFRGQAVIAVPVYVPVRRIQSGVLLTSEDFHMVDIAMMAMPANTLRSPKDILGMESRRILLGGRPVVAGSVSEPLVIERGDEVTIILSSGGLNLSAPGKTLEDGAIGQDVRVVNLKSNASLTATVVSKGVVEVSAK
nr:flagellar basal body P-ring formation chaperone FlgA [Amylibacter sp.]